MNAGFAMVWRLRGTLYRDRMKRYKALQLQFFDTQDNYDNSRHYFDGAPVIDRRPIFVWGWGPGPKRLG